MNSDSRILGSVKYNTDFSPVRTLNAWILFGLICSLYFVQAYISNTFVFTDQLYYRSLSDQLTFKSIQTFLNVQKQYWWLGYVFTPFIIALKVSFTTVCISIGAVLSNIEFKFKTIFKASLLAEIVFIGAQALFLINISFHLDTVTLTTTANYYPLSALSYFGTNNVVDWLEYPLQTVNLFEVAYMVAVAWLLAKQWKEDFLESLAVVFPSYVTGLILWLVLVTFLTLQVS